MRFFAFIVPPRFTVDKRCISKLVEKVSILALLLAASISLASCGGEDLPEVDPAEVIAAADSAGRALSGELAIKRDSTNRPSIYFDTLYRHYVGGRLLERDKRIDADSLARAGVLAIDNMKDAASRANGRSILQSFLQRDEQRSAQRDSIARAIHASLDRMLDSTSIDSNAMQSLLQNLTARPRFEPEWRTTLDSLTRETIYTEIAILHFLDTASRRIQIDEVIKFSDANDIAHYQAMTSKLSQLAMAQQELVDRVTFGIPLTPEDSARQRSDSVAARPSSPAPSWPGAVKVQ